jgi:hypothetical protein
VRAQCGMGVPSCGAADEGEGRFLAGLGVLTREISPELVDSVVEVAGCREQRRRLLPAVTMVYFVLGMCLLSGADSMGPPGYRSVMRQLTHGLRQVRDGAGQATRQAFTKARQRLGCKVMELLFDEVRGPRAGPGLAGAFAFGRRLVAWDGTDLDTADTPANRAGFGSHLGSAPKLRLVALIECGTRAVIDAAFDSFAVAEAVLARRVLASLQPGMLLLADRLVPGYELWGLARSTGADLLWRARNNLVFTPVRELGDGSYLAVMATPAENKRLGTARWRGKVPDRIPDGHLVRVIEYHVDVMTPGGTRVSEQFRLVTTLLDPQEAPAAALAALYRERWQSETGYGELKTRLRGSGFTLRSRTPDLTCQEVLAFLITCQALNSLRARAAASAGLDPDLVSFTVVVRTARDYATSWTGPAGLDRDCRNAIADITAAPDLIEPRPGRRSDRVTSWPRAGKKYKKTRQPRNTGKVRYTLRLRPAAQAP